MKQTVFTIFVILLLGGMTGCGTSDGISEGEVGVIPEEEITENLPEEPEEEVDVIPQEDVTEDLHRKEVIKDLPVVILLSATPDTDRVLLRWSAIEDAADYQIKWGEGKEMLEYSINIDANQTHFLHQGLIPETTYSYSIYATYAKGYSSDPSNIVTVITGSLSRVTQSDVAY